MLTSSRVGSKRPVYLVASALVVAGCAAAGREATPGAAWNRLVDSPAGIVLRFPPGWYADASAEAAQLVVASYPLPARAADSPEPHRLPAHGAFVSIFPTPLPLMLPSARRSYPPRPQRISLAAGQHASFEGFGPGTMLKFRDRGYAIQAMIALGPKASATTKARVIGVLEATRLIPLSQREQTIRIGAAPMGIAYGHGSVWVATARTLLRLAPPNGRTIARIPLPAGGDYRHVTVGAGRVWVTDGAGPRGSLVEIDPGRARIRRVLAVPCCTIGVAAGAGAIWTSRPAQGPGQVLRLDPWSGRVTARIRVGFSPSAIVVADDSVWVSNTSVQTSLMRIDPYTNKVTATIERGQGISDLAVGSSGLWATENHQIAVRLDPASGRVLRRVGFPATALQLAVGQGELWASALNCRSCAQGFVTRLRLRTGIAGPAIPVGQTPVALIVGGGALWVANFKSGTVTSSDG
jgi:hypothetical protein